MLDHIEIYVRDLEKTRQYYDLLFSLLGWELYQEWQYGFSYKIDAYYIVFVQAEDNHLSNLYHRKNIGLNHLAFQVGSDDKVDTIREQLLRNKAIELYADAYPYASGAGYYAVFVEDPDRIKIEIVSRNI